MSLSVFSKASSILLAVFVMAIVTSPVSALEPSDINRTATPTAAKKLLQQKQLQKQENVEEKLASMREKFASRAAALKTKLQAFKDQRKASIAERLNTNFNNVNQNQTRLMQKHLDLMTQILNKLESRVNKATPDIKDPTAAKSAIASAREVIATTSAAVALQAGNDYTIQISSEAAVKTAAKTQRDRLHTDVQTLRKQVIEAKLAVANAIKVAKTGFVLSGAELNKEGTSSGTQ